MLRTACERHEDCAGYLLAEFGSIRRILGVEHTRLRIALSECPETLDHLNRLRALGIRALRHDVERIQLNGWQRLVPYLRARIGCWTVEQARYIFLDKGLRLIAEEGGPTGTIDHAPVYVRTVVGRAIEVGASNVIMAHNHPGGSAIFSGDDVHMTNKIERALDAVDIRLIDHVLVTENECISARAIGLMAKYKNEFGQNRYL